LRLALQFNLCLLLLTQVALAQVKDRYLFRLGEVVVGVNDLAQGHADLVALRCRFPDTFLEAWTSPSYLTKSKATVAKLASATTPLGQDQSSIIFLASLRQLWKLLVYVDGQEVTISKDLEKQIINTSGCPSVTMSGGKMRDSFRRWLRVEVYLRARYAPSGMKSEKDWREKRLLSISQFADSVDKQLNHENFW